MTIQTVQPFTQYRKCRHAKNYRWKRTTTSSDELKQNSQITHDIDQTPKQKQCICQLNLHFETVNAECHENTTKFRSNLIFKM